MPSEQALLLTAFALLAAACGWFVARATHRPQTPPSRPQGEYFEGLNFLLNEQPDKALEVFSKLVEVDDDTIETHFALGALFRRRGEVDRAIRIHQNILARPDLAREHHHEALYQLGVDHLRAGLFDRAEVLFRDLSLEAAHRSDALQNLVRIYEQQKDWEQAVAVRKELAAATPEGHNPVIAQYYCELAAEAIEAGDNEAARTALRHAQDKDRFGPRGLLMRAELAATMGDRPLAEKLYWRLIEHHPNYVFETLPRQAALVSNAADLERGYERLLARNSALAPKLGFAAIVHAINGGPVIAAAKQACLADNEVIQRLYVPADSGPRPSSAPLPGQSAAQAAQEHAAMAALRQLATSTPIYRCADCGYASADLYWQCPGCKEWGQTRPGTELALEFGRSESEPS